MKVLIVDDNKQMRRMIKTFVEDLVDEFAECADGSEALDAYREFQPDMVLMDLKMARIDGLAAIKQIKNVFPEARIVIVSQWDDGALRRKAEAAGAEDYVGKADLLPLRHILAGG